ncbi:hypothetical protein ARSEF4850_002933 [Beauveria asiatica]
MDTASSRHNHFSFVPDLASFGDFISPSATASQLASGGSSEFLPGQGHRPNPFFANQAPTSLPRDAGQHCINCGFHPAAPETSDMRLQSLCARVERVELAVVQLQLAVKSSMASHAASIEQIKNGMGRFFERFADQFSDGEEGTGGDDGNGGDDGTGGDERTGGDDGTSVKNQVTQNHCG